MSKQPEALRLADELEADWHKAKKSGQVMLSSADELRRLHAANVELVEALKTIVTSSEQSGQPLNEWASVPFANARASIKKHGG